MQTRNVEQKDGHNLEISQCYLATWRTGTGTRTACASPSRSGLPTASHCISHHPYPPSPTTLLCKCTTPSCPPHCAVLPRPLMPTTHDRASTYVLARSPNLTDGEELFTLSTSILNCRPQSYCINVLLCLGLSLSLCTTTLVQSNISELMIRVESRAARCRDLLNSSPRFNLINLINFLADPYT